MELISVMGMSARAMAPKAHTTLMATTSMGATTPMGWRNMMPRTRNMTAKEAASRMRMSLIM